MLTVFLASLLLVSGTVAQEEDASAAKAAKIKAVFLYNFIKFVEWPAERSPVATRKATICLMGGNKFGSALDNLRKSLTGQMELTVESDVAASSIGACNVLFITHASGGELAQAVESARRNGVLTVSEMNGFADNGGIIEMKTVEKTIGLFSSNKINLRINLKAADAASLKISAQLLEIAAEVLK